MTHSQLDLFATSLGPEGLRYRPEFLSLAEERDLLAAIRELTFIEARYKEWTAKRRIVSFGYSYDFDRNALGPAEPIPVFLLPLRARVATETGWPETEFEQALVAEYQPGVQLGWHRDVPSFERIAGISLLGAARMRFRPWPPSSDGPRRAAFALALEPRSFYQLSGDARWKWQHAISPTKALRYSITFRTLALRERSRAVGSSE